ncbi:coiled-coil domain-containing protein 57 isoform X2 [Hyla sarda]|uniref:coiled-coil domain-containing protein 57 isoform X2 n=1 Tax=Hyla sarda TaxID=327740 RepID=UPI0024C2926F|nr:coiled-coil domain-containing protein 57 isoform X2 [Hyla sarda]
MNRLQALMLVILLTGITMRAWSENILGMGLRLLHVLGVMLPNETDLSELLAKKEQEWKELQQRQILALQQNLKGALKNLQEEKDKFNRLKNDFTHNLKVLGERDRELERYEVMYSRIKVLENAKQSEISDLKIQIEKLQQEIQREKKKYDDLQSHYQRRVKEHQLDLERVNSSKNGDVDRLRGEYENVKRQLERKIEKVQGDLSLQRQELSLEFDCEMKKREHEFRLRLDEMSTVVLSHELKAKLLTKELEVMREMELKGAETIQETESTNQRLQEALKLKEFEMKELSAVKDARIKELEEKLQSMQHQMKKQEETFQRKHVQLDRLAREKESALESMKEAHAEHARRLEKQVKELQMCVETLQAEQQRAQCRQKATLTERDSTIDKLKDDVATLKNGWDSYVTQVSKDTVTKDLQIQALQEEEQKIKAEMAKYQKDIERYQQQLACSLERERILEQARVQVELDWQKRCEKAEKKQYQKSEELIENLSKAKEQLEADMKEKERRLSELQLLVSTLSWERDQTLKMASKYPGEQTLGAVPDFASKEIHKLQEQNSELREVIGQMRKEMESLCQQISPPHPERTESPSRNTTENVATADYVKSLEVEIQDLKQKNRLMEEKFQEALLPKDNPERPSTAKPVSPDNIYIQNHISSLNETIGALKADKVASSAAYKKLEARAAHLESMVTELTQKVQQKQVEVSQLQFQLNSETRHNQATISSLRQRQSELEMQLTEARKEAEEFFKGNLTQNLETVGLGKEVSALKLELASQRVPVVLSETAMVKELREEILTLRQQLAVLSCPDGGPANPYILRNKLKEAVKKISQLSLEKQQLIDMGNRLRAELAAAAGGNAPKDSIPSVIKMPPTKLQAAETQNRLSALEGLQYQLTSQELQFAQYQKPHSLSAMDQSTTGVKNKRNQYSTSEEPKPTWKENMSPSPHGRLMNSSEASWIQGDSSSQEVWKILDMGSSPSLISSQEDAPQVTTTRSHPGLRNQNTKHSSLRKGSEKPSQSLNTRQTKGRGSHNTPKIRNYNIRD